MTVTSYKVLADAFLNEGEVTADQLLDSDFRRAAMSDEQISQMKELAEVKFKRNAIAIDNAFQQASFYHGKMTRVIIHLLYLGEKNKVYAGALPNNEEYQSFEEWARVKAGGRIEDDLLSRYCNSVRDMLIPISENPPPLTAEQRVQWRRDRIEELTEEGEGITVHDPEVAQLTSEIEAIESGEDDTYEAMDVEMLLDRISNTKTIKEMPYVYKMLNEENQELADHLVGAMFDGLSHSKIRRLSDDLRRKVEPSDDEEEEQKQARPVLTILNVEGGVQINGVVPDWVADTLVATFGDKIDFRFNEGE